MISIFRMSDIKKPTSLQSIFMTLQQRTQAGTVLLGAAIVDQQLQDAILTKLHKVSRSLENELFAGYGPLASLSAKIALAYAMGLLDHLNYKRLTVARQIRNKFAHTDDFIDFETPEIRKLIGKFPTNAPSDLKGEFIYFWQLQQVEQYLVATAGQHILKPSKTITVV